ncbi:uncharacterized protein [Palaemon carinicauda]|uniref:uncharacterized protein n=1 Tax=Palaemon carinicauda TaxID=392227 RepID=UPI0035B5E6D7
MFPASKRQAFQLLLAMLAVSLTVAMTAPREEEEPLKYCQKAIRNCRLKTNWEDLDGQRFVNLNISCFCESDEPEDVWEALEEVSHHKCTAVPMNDDYKVNHSSIHITGCNINKEVFPLAVMQLARRSDHLEFVLNQCPYVRFGMLTKEQRRVPRLSVSFKDSKLSGLPRGWLVNAEKMDVQIEGCDIAIVEPKAISGFTDGDDVSIEIRNTNISTVQNWAFQLPPLGTLTIKDSRVTTWSKSGYEGGSEVNLSGVTFARVLVDGFNLHGVKSFNMTDCNVAELSAEAITDNDRQGKGMIGFCTFNNKQRVYKTRLLRHISEEPDSGGGASGGEDDPEIRQPGRSSTPGTPRSPAIDIDDVFKQKQKEIEDGNKDDMSRVKDLAMRLKLATRRPSYLEWLGTIKQKSQEMTNVLESHPPLVLEEGKPEEEPTDEVRKKNLQSALSWLRQELMDMRQQDQQLARQLMQLRIELQRVRLLRSCNNHQALVDEVANEAEEARTYESSDLCEVPPDLRETFSPILREIGVTRMNITSRRFSLR